MNKQDLSNKVNNAQTKMDLYDVAGKLNNFPEHITQDKVTIMAFMDFADAKKYVLALIDETNGL